jgi:opacity protein-like surface antigen
MTKRVFFSVLLFSSSITSSYSQITPLATLSLGGSYVAKQQRQAITFISPFEDTYLGRLSQTQLVGGLFLGIRTPITQNVEGQIGISYYRTDSFVTSGTIYQFSSPDFANLGYRYNTQFQRIYFEGKLLTTWKKQLHPFINAAVGQAQNKSFDYYEFPLVSHAVPGATPFANQSSSAFSYMLGLGLEKELRPHIRLGGSYRFVDFNDAHLSLSPDQESIAALGYNKLNASEFLIQLSYLG